MKIKRYVAPTMREAIAQVREEQGPEAVILSNRRIDGGMEVIAAIDYDEGLMTQAVAQLAPKRAAPAESATKEQQVRQDKNPPEQKPAQTEQLRSARDTGRAATLRAADERPRSDGGTVAATVADRMSASEPPGMDSRRSPERSPRPSAAVHPASRIEWSQDPAITSMRNEVQGMREMLESQLASLAWNDLGRRAPMKTKVLRDLTALDIAPDIAREIVQEMPSIDSLRDSWKIPLGLLVKRIPVTDDGILEHGGVVAVVGPTGVGKTTTIAKIAARFALKHGAHHVALVSTDTYRIGAREQLLTYARILGVSMHVAQDSRELATVLEQLEMKKLVLIDTAGMSQRDLRLNEQFATLHNDRARIRVLLALSAAAEYSALEETVRVFERIKPSACVLTKLDEAASLGAPLSIAIRHGLAIAHLCDGQRVPEDLHAAFSRRSWLVQTALKMRRESQRVADEGMLAEQFGRMAAHA